MTEPSKCYHNLRFFEYFGDFGWLLKARSEMLRDYGPCQSPFNAFLLLQGLETLHVRMEHHVSNARQVAEYLKSNKAVTWVNYPGFPDSPYYKLCKKYLPAGPGAIFTFGIKGGREAGKKLIENVQLFSHLANVGDCKSLIIHPATTTHQQLTNEELAACGIGPDMIRLSIGIEDIDDILWDLEQALENGQKLNKAFQRMRGQLDQFLDLLADLPDGGAGKLQAPRSLREHPVQLVDLRQFPEFFAPVFR